MIAKDNFHPASRTPVACVFFEWLQQRILFFGVLFLWLVAFSSQATAQTPAPKPAGSSSVSLGTKGVGTKVVTAAKPAWAELTPVQQQILKPLSATWETISESQKRKWIEISKNYPNLPPEGQAKMHGRMSEWVALSPQQRAEARLNFAKTKELSKQLTPEEQKAKWQTYQSLSPEEKQKLAAKATARPTGAATAVKPVAPQKLAAVPTGGAKPPNKIPSSQQGAKPVPAIDTSAAGKALPVLQH